MSFPSRISFTLALLLVLPATHSLLLAQPVEIRSADFISGDTGWLLADDSLLYTDDGGQSWQKFGFDLEGVSDSEVELVMIDFASESIGFAAVEVLHLWVGSPNMIVKTEDGGRSWRVQEDLDEHYFIADIQVLDENTVIAAGGVGATDYASGFVLKTEDGGASWSEVFSDSVDIYSVSFLDAGHGLLTGAANELRPTLWSTSDGHETWHEQSIPPFSDSFSLNFSQPQVVDTLSAFFLAGSCNYLPQCVLSSCGWACSGEYLYATTDDFASFYVTARHIDSYLAIDERQLVAFSAAEGLLVLSMDQGATWTPRYPGIASRSPDGSRSNHVTLQAVADSIVWAVDMHGLVLRSADRGVRWADRSPDPSLLRIGTSIDESFGTGSPAQGFGLHQNHPNPFRSGTTIEYALSTTSFVEIEVINLLGQRVATIQRSRQAPGSHSAQWNGQYDSGELAAPGLYLYRLSAYGVDGLVSSAVRTMVVAR